MKKIISFLLCLFSAVAISACSSSKTPTVEVQENVSFTLLDVLEVDNEQTNTVFFYFLGSVDNESEQDFHMTNLHYVMTAEGQTVTDAVNPIDQFQAYMTNDIRPGTSSFVYGYIGVPRTGAKNLGLYFTSQEVFIPFNSLKIRTMNDGNITNSDETKFTIYEDNDFEFDVDTSEVTYRYENGKSIIDGLIINYKNKTDGRLVVPYLTPICTINGIDLKTMPDGDNLIHMSEDELRQQNFSTNGMDAKTTSITCEAYGYQLFYLPAGQEVPVKISFEADGVIPDFSSSSKDGISININSPALGYSQKINVSY